MRRHARGCMRARLAALPRRCYTTRPALRPFRVEQYEGWFDGSDSLTSSECEPLSLRELLAMADPPSLARWEALSLGYPAYNHGSLDLREEISASYGGAERLSAELVNVCAPNEGINLAMNALLAPGDGVVATTPCYQSLTEVARSIGCEIVGWHPRFAAAAGDGRSARARFDVDELLELLERHPRTRLLCCNFPHNPTGALPTRDDFARLVERCRRGGIHLFIDEMYRGLEHEGVEQLPSAVDAYERGVSLGGLSKSFGLPGLRIGWLACRDPAVMARVSVIKDFISICPPVPSEVLGVVALRSRGAILAAQRERVAAGLAALRGFMARHAEHFEWLEPSAGTFAFPRLRASGDVSSEAYCSRLRQRAGLMLMPSAIFSAHGDWDEAAGVGERVRVTFGRSQTEPLLKRWAEDLEAHGVAV